MAIDVVAAQTVEAGTTDPIGHGLARKAVFEGEATNRVIRLAEAAGVPVYIVHLSASDALAEVRAARDRGHEGVRRDMPAVPVPVARRPRQRVRRRQVRVLAAAPAEGPLGRAVDRPRQGRPPARRRPTTARSTSTARRSSGGATSARSPTACRASRTGSTCSTTAASSAAGSRRSAGSRSSRRRRPSCSGCTRRRARSSVGADADLVVYDPNREADDLGQDAPHGRGLLVLRGPQGPGRSDIVLSRGSVIVRDGEFTGRKGHGRFVKRAAGRLRPARLSAAGDDGDRATIRDPGRSRAARRRARTSFATCGACGRRRRPASTTSSRRSTRPRRTSSSTAMPAGRAGSTWRSPGIGDELVVTLRTRRRRSTRRAVPEPDLTDPARAPAARRDGHPPHPRGDRWARPSTTTRRRQHPDPDRAPRSTPEGGPIDGPGDDGRAGRGARPDHGRGPRWRARRLEFEELVDTVRGLYDDGHRALLIDLAGLRFMASSGLVALHSIVRLMHGERRRPRSRLGCDPLAGPRRERRLDADRGPAVCGPSRPSSESSAAPD